MRRNNIDYFWLTDKQKDIRIVLKNNIFKIPNSISPHIKKEIKIFNSEIKKRKVNSIIPKLKNYKKYGIQFSTFAGFCNGLHITMGDLQNFLSDEKIKQGEKKKGIQKLLKIFTLNRKINDYVQAEYDRREFRRQASAGQNVVIDIAQKYGIDKETDLKKINKKHNFVISLKTLNLFRELQKKFGIKYDIDRMDKPPDNYMQINQEKYIIEVKGTKGEGGGQSSSVYELSSIIKLRSKNIHYVSLNTGNRIDAVRYKESPKNRKARKQILKLLKKNKNNYLVDKAGFEEIIKDKIKGC